MRVQLLKLKHLACVVCLVIRTRRAGLANRKLCGRIADFRRTKIARFLMMAKHGTARGNLVQQRLCYGYY